MHHSTWRSVPFGSAYLAEDLPLFPHLAITLTFLLRFTEFSITCGSQTCCNVKRNHFSIVTKLIRLEPAELSQLLPGSIIQSSLKSEQCANPRMLPHCRPFGWDRICSWTLGILAVLAVSLVLRRERIVDQWLLGVEFPVPSISKGSIIISGTSSGIGRATCGHLAVRHPELTMYFRIRNPSAAQGYPFTYTHFGSMDETCQAIEDALFSKHPKTRYITFRMIVFPTWLFVPVINSFPTDSLGDWFMQNRFLLALPVGIVEMQAAMDAMLTRLSGGTGEKVKEWAWRDTQQSYLPMECTIISKEYLYIC